MEHLTLSEAERSSMLGARPRRPRDKWQPGMPAARLAVLLTFVGVAALAWPQRSGAPGRADLRHRHSSSSDAASDAGEPDGVPVGANISATDSISPVGGKDSDTATSTKCASTRHQHGVDLSLYNYELTNSSAQICVSLNNDYERQLGIVIGDGIYPYDLLAEMHQARADSARPRARLSAETTRLTPARVPRPPPSPRARRTRASGRTAGWSSTRTSTTSSRRTTSRTRSARATTRAPCTSARSACTTSTSSTAR